MYQIITRTDYVRVRVYTTDYSSSTNQVFIDHAWFVEISGDEGDGAPPSETPHELQSLPINTQAGNHKINSTSWKTTPWMHVLGEPLSNSYTKRPLLPLS